MSISVPPLYVDKIYNPTNFVNNNVYVELSGKQDTLSPTNRLDASLIANGVVSNAAFATVATATAPIQSQLANLGSRIEDLDYAFTERLGGVTNVQTQVDAKQNKVAGVTDQVLGYLVGVGASIQTALNARSLLFTSSNRLPASDVGTGSVSDLRFSYLEGLTSPLQTQINACLRTTVANVFTTVQTLGGLLTRIRFVKGLAGFPTLGSAVAAVYVDNNNTDLFKALTFLKTTDPATDNANDIAFIFSKMTTVNTAIDLMTIRNNGNTSVLGACNVTNPISTPTLTVSSTFSCRRQTGTFEALEFGVLDSMSVEYTFATLPSVIAILPNIKTYPTVYLPNPSSTHNGIRCTVLLRGADSIRIQSIYPDVFSVNGVDVYVLELTSLGKKRDFVVVGGKWTCLTD